MPRLHPDFLVKPLAHRGLHGGEIPENSRAAMTAAIDAGYGIELDLQLSQDGEAMVFHDYDLERLTEQAGPIRMQPIAALANYKLQNAESIPTLAEILALVAGRVPLLLEIKDQDGALGTNVGQLANRTAELVTKYDGPVAVMSFNPHAIYAVQKYSPEITRGLVTGHFLEENWGLVPAARRDHLNDIPDFDGCGAAFISHSYTHLEMLRVAEIRATGAPVLCWTIKNTVDEIEARRFADNITFEGYLP